VIDAAQAEKSGALVVEADAISKSFGGRPIVANFSTRIMRGDRIGVVVRTAAARPRWSIFWPARSRPTAARSASAPISRW